jgi:catalase
MRRASRSLCDIASFQEAGEHYLDDAARKSKGPNYLSEEIAARVANAPIEFDWLAQIAEPGDKIEDPSIAWPERRELVSLGTIRIDRVVPNQVPRTRRYCSSPAVCRPAWKPPIHGPNLDHIPLTTWPRISPAG